MYEKNYLVGELMENFNSLYQSNILYRIKVLEGVPTTTTNQNNDYDINEEIPFKYYGDYLYHGIRFQKHLEKLENIFKIRKILAGKYISEYHFYGDNCNKGEYVSLFKWINNNIIEYETFIESNISLLITPAINAIETRYISYNDWEKIMSEKLPLKNLYSYMQGECLIKDYISLDYVKAIGVPYLKLMRQGKQEYADKLIDDIQKLMEQYNINLPIVDTSRYNYILIDTNKKLENKKNKRGEKMRKSVKYYTGYEITDEVIERINLIEQERIQEGITDIITNEPIYTLKDLCRLHNTFPHEENIVLGEDWYIIYTKYDQDTEEIQIHEWLDINNTENKLTQTMEMLTAMKKIFLQNKNAKIYATMRHSTSYKFYQILLTRGLVEEISNNPDIDEELPSDIEIILNNLQSKYNSLKEYLLNEDKEIIGNQKIKDYIYHSVNFKITDKFIRRYIK